VKGFTYFKSWGFSINEGGTPINIHVQWKNRMYFYLYFFGKRIVLLKERT
jgi:hypothetical protein